MCRCGGKSLNGAEAVSDRLVAAAGMRVIRRNGVQVLVPDVSPKAARSAAVPALPVRTKVSP